jgi:hypothetical protein
MIRLLFIICLQSLFVRCAAQNFPYRDEISGGFGYATISFMSKIDTSFEAEYAHSKLRSYWIHFTRRIDNNTQIGIGATWADNFSTYTINNKWQGYSREYYRSRIFSINPSLTITLLKPRKLEVYSGFILGCGIHFEESEFENDATFRATGLTILPQVIALGFRTVNRRRLGGNIEFGGGFLFFIRGGLNWEIRPSNKTFIRKFEE